MSDVTVEFNHAVICMAWHKLRLMISLLFDSVIIVEGCILRYCNNAYVHAKIHP